MKQLLLGLIAGFVLWSGHLAYANEINLNVLISPVPPESKYHDDDYYIWGGSVIAGPQGKYHILRSRWLRKTGFNGWVTHSEIAYAVSDSAAGPYRHVNVALPARGADKWDGLCTHMRGSFTGKRHSTAIFDSTDGVKWKLAKNRLVTTTQINWQDGGLEKVERLERPQLLLEDGVPMILFCAVKKGNNTFNVHIPLKRE
jgi:hypothetical protein